MRLRAAIAQRVKRIDCRFGVRFLGGHVIGVPEYPDAAVTITFLNGTSAFMHFFNTPEGPKCYLMK
jgi:hypothetical protein